MGSYKTSNYDENKVILTIVDDHSRSSWVYLMKSKKEVFLHVQSFLLMINNQFGNVVKLFAVTMTQSSSIFFAKICFSHTTFYIRLIVLQLCSRIG